MKLCWADKLVTIWLLFLTAVILVVQKPGGFDESIAHLYDGWLVLYFKLGLVPWLFLRFIDLLIDGPKQRARREQEGRAAGAR